jgi:hypothetical protein
MMPGTARVIRRLKSAFGSGQKDSLQDQFFQVEGSFNADNVQANPERKQQAS